MLIWFLAAGAGSSVNRVGFPPACFFGASARTAAFFGTGTFSRSESLTESLSEDEEDVAEDVADEESEAREVKVDGFFESPVSVTDESDVAVGALRGFAAVPFRVANFVGDD